MTETVTSDFRTKFRAWRLYRNKSQLDLALFANISQRHLSFLETGRSLPSREMVLKLSEALDIPLRERNGLLLSAGYSPIYAENSLDSPSMLPVLNAVEKALQHHNPLPAFVVDRFWNIVRKNSAAEKLLMLLSSTSIPVNDESESTNSSVEISTNLALMSLHPLGLRQFITNWDDVAPLLVQRLRSEAMASGDQKVIEKLQSYVEVSELYIQDTVPNLGLLPVMPINIKVDNIELSLFTMVATLGTPQDVIADELRLEFFYSIDDQTEDFFRSISS
ncbi:helix-turn-helix domain-containing protein [Marinomonas atlantica]|uniref:helix-turn-helix domain-containing protein n=1 Tax=Marinomonas atlantica TaxID=1806668 RepID=UPI00082CA783|nr:helix-turn-helix transcriptional regulator [Marinomonas atlantica]